MGALKGSADLDHPVDHFCPIVPSDLMAVQGAHIDQVSVSKVEALLHFLLN